MKNNTTLKTLHEGYLCLQDDLSRDIFAELMGFHVTKNKKFLRHLLPLSTFQVCRTDDKIQKKLKKWSETYSVLVLYGAGQMASFYLGLFDFSCFQQVFFCDRNFEKIKNKEGYPVISPQEAQERYGKTGFFINTTAFSGEEIKKSLHSIPNSQYYGEDLNGVETRYFDDIFDLNNFDVLVDASGFSGEPSLYFQKELAKSEKKQTEIFLLPKEEETLSSAVETLENCTVLKDFSKLNPEQFKNKNTLMKLHDFDFDFYKKQEKFFRTVSPTLAISGCEEVFPELLLFFKEISPDYTFYLRHYTELRSETVLYVVKGGHNSKDGVS